MKFMNYNSQTGRVEGFFTYQDPGFEKDYNDKSIFITEDMIKEINGQGEVYIIDVSKTDALDRSIVLDVDVFHEYFKPEIPVKIIETKIAPEQLAMAEAIADLYEKLYAVGGMKNVSYTKRLYD